MRVLFFACPLGLGGLAAGRARPAPPGPARGLDFYLGQARLNSPLSHDVRNQGPLQQPRFQPALFQRGPVPAGFICSSPSA